MTNRAIRIDINETKHAFRINGVTFAKKKLSELLPLWGDDVDSFYRYLVIMPFFATSKDVGSAPTPLGNYAIAKSKRIFDTLELDNNAIPVFMMMAAQMGHIEEEGFSECLSDLSNQTHDAICNCGVKKSGRIKSGHTVH